MNTTTVVKKYIPVPVKRYLRDQHRRSVLTRSLNRIRGASDPAALVREIAPDLVYGWSNEGYSALDEYLVALMSAALTVKGPILECGSGLSTLLLGLAAERTGNRVWSLEHNPQWAAQLNSTLARHGIESVEVVQRPLVPFGSFAWYGVDKAQMPKDFGLVICDGPPGDTNGGRYGLLPQMRDHLQPGCVILADDAQRDEELAMVKRWSTELGAPYEIVGTDKPFARLIVPAK